MWWHEERVFFFKLSLHGTPYNVFENRDHTNILQSYIIILSIFFSLRLGSGYAWKCLWYAD